MAKYRGNRRFNVFVYLGALNYTKTLDFMIHLELVRIVVTQVTWAFLKVFIASIEFYSNVVRVC